MKICSGNCTSVSEKQFRNNQPQCKDNFHHGIHKCLSALLCSRIHAPCTSSLYIAMFDTNVIFFCNTKTLWMTAHLCLVYVAMFDTHPISFGNAKTLRMITPLKMSLGFASLNVHSTGGQCTRPTHWQLTLWPLMYLQLMTGGQHSGDRWNGGQRTDSPHTGGRGTGS